MMKNKKTIMALSFGIGAVLLATTAFADIAIKTGYDQVKDSLKYTANALTKEVKSYTLSGTASIKDNDKVIGSASNIAKYDIVNQAEETISVDDRMNGQKEKETYYIYQDSKEMITNYSSSSDTFFITEKSKSNEYRHSSFLTSFFNEDPVAVDVEKIVDAVVGNLKDYVVATENPDGSKEFYGSLSEAQIPSLVNAVASFGFKQQFSQAYNQSNPRGLPQLAQDIFVKNANGNITVNTDGIIDGVLASATLTGKDKDGTFHDVTFEILIKVTDINSTTVTKPDLTDKKVEKMATPNIDGGNIESFVGKYKNDIVLLKDDQFIKIGERVLEISQVKDKTISGIYSEVYGPEFADDYTPTTITFTADMKDPYSGILSGTDQEGKEVKGNLHPDYQNGNIHFYPNSFKNYFNGTFARIFEN